MDEIIVEYDNQVMHHPKALVVYSISTAELGNNPQDSVPDRFKNWMHIMSKAVAKCLLEPTSNDHSIDLKIGKTPR
jgi:hypothetical protein